MDGSGTEQLGCSAGTSSRCRCLLELQWRCDWTDRITAEGPRVGEGQIDWLMAPLPEHGNEQVDEEDVGDQQINHQQNDHQPVTVINPAGLCTVLNHRHVFCALHVPHLPHWDTKMSLKLDWDTQFFSVMNIPSISSTGICPKMCRYGR